MGSLLCEKRLYNVESVETAALDVQVIGVDFPTVPFISGEVERLEYVSPKQWERRRLKAMAKKARLEMAKPRPKTSPYRTRPGRKQSKERIPIISMERPGSERNLLKCTRVSLTIQKERESLTTPMQKNPRLSAPSRRDSRSMSWTERPSTSHAALGGEIPPASVPIPDPTALGGPSPPSPHPREVTPSSPRVRSQSAKPSTGHIIHNLPKPKQHPQKTSQKMYKTRTSQYAERVKAVRKLQVQAQGELEARLATLNIDLGSLATKNIDNAQPV